MGDAGTGAPNDLASLGATIGNISSWFVEMEHVHSSTLLLATLAGLALEAGVLYQIGLIGWALWGLGLVVRGGIRAGFRLWERLLAWAPWPLFLALVVGFLVGGGVAGGPLPSVRVACGLAPLLMGAHRLPGLYVHRPGTV